MAEPTQPGNPHGLTVRQHTFPVRSIARFAAPNGLVTVFNRLNGKIHPAAPRNPLFCAERAWDQRAERLMKPIEDEFQRLTDAVIAARCGYEITPDDAEKINQFYSLWHHRARRRELPYEFTTLNGVTGNTLTKDQQEILEVKGYTFIREDKTIAFRHINGMRLHMDAGRYVDDLRAATHWGVIEATDGEFIVPDVPVLTVIPLTPELAFGSTTVNGRITRANLIEVNRAMIAASERYYFSRNRHKAYF